ncbi:MAG: hypothetical protein JNL28_14185 [Planctomycetes bacterium]|nr:hypothetical protein [Planctomycetota bacterium]
MPRSLSTKTLVTLVTVVVLGTAVTVHRYIESSGSADAGGFHAVRGSGEVRAADESMRSMPAARAISLSPIQGGRSYCESRSTSVSGCTSTAPATPTQSPSPSSFQPLFEQSGG